MNNNDPLQLLQKGFHITLGVAASAMESLQDAQKRQENLEQLRLNPNQFSETLAAKGKTTEQDARSFVDQLWSQRAPRTATSATSGGEDSGVTANRFQQELQELTNQIAEIRSQLEQARQNKN
jgi:polyhydroxyalkanoate synthesis regulator phasin